MESVAEKQDEQLHDEKAQLQKKFEPLLRFATEHGPENVLTWALIGMNSVEEKQKDDVSDETSSSDDESNEEHDEDHHTSSTANSAPNSARGKKVGTKDCRNGINCWNETCTFKHPVGWNPVQNKKKRSQGKASSTKTSQKQNPSERPVTRMEFDTLKSTVSQMQQAFTELQRSVRKTLDQTETSEDRSVKKILGSTEVKFDDSDDSEKQNKKDKKEKKKDKKGKKEKQDKKDKK